MNRWMLMTAALALLLTPAARADQGVAGSVGIFPIQRSAFDTGASAFTIISVTNTNTLPSSGGTNVRYQYMNLIQNPANKFEPLACLIFDRVEHLTPADTFSVLTGCHNAVFGMQEGYLIVSAQDPGMFNRDWSYNYLVGSELVINGSGAALSMNMLPFSSPRESLRMTDVNGNGQLDFDGVEYQAVSDVLIIDSFVARLDSHLMLINLTGRDDAVNTVRFNVWNDNEFPLSATLNFKCWFDEPLSDISTLFSEPFLVLNTPDDPSELDINCDAIGDLETGWAMIDSVNVSDMGGFLAHDGALVGAISSGPASIVDGGHLLWEGRAVQTNGSFFGFPGPGADADGGQADD